MKNLIKISIAVLILGVYLFGVLGMASALVVDAVSTNPSEIEPGQSSIIEIELENDGEEDIEDVNVVLDLNNVPFAPFESSSGDFIDEIDEDDSETARFKIIALNDAETGIYKIPISISYKKDGETKDLNSLISVKVDSEPVLGVSIQNELLLKGERNVLEIEIVNKGLSDIRFVEVELRDSVYRNILSQKNIYLGDLDSDDFDNVEFNVFYKDNVPERTNIYVELKYRDNSNKEYSEEFSVPVEVYSHEKAVELGLIPSSRTNVYIGIGILVVVVFLIWRYFRKKAKKKRNSEF